jgi:hypothetical protein
VPSGEFLEKIKIISHGMKFFIKNEAYFSLFSGGTSQIAKLSIFCPFFARFLSYKNVVLF